MTNFGGGVSRFGDVDSLARTIAGEMAARLARACAERSQAALVLSGGRSPVQLLEVG